MKAANDLWDSHTLKDGEVLKKPIHVFSDTPDETKSLLFQKSSAVIQYNQARREGLHHAIVEVGNNLSDLLDLLPGFSYDCNKSRIKKLEVMLTYLKEQL